VVKGKRVPVLNYKYDHVIREIRDRKYPFMHSEGQHYVEVHVQFHAAKDLPPKMQSPYQR